MPSASETIPAERIERRILLLRGQKVLLDFQLAELYEVEARALNQAVKRNGERFPEDFMFRPTAEETERVLRLQMAAPMPDNSSQSVMSSKASGPKSAEPSASDPAQLVTGSRKHRGLAYRPYAFTEQGVAMLSSVLRSPRAVQVNIAIMRTFVQLRQMLASHADLARKLASLERTYDEQFRVVFDAIRKLMEPPTPAQKREIGFHTNRSSPGAKARARTTTTATISP
jgi:hypothetical protein